MKKGMILYVTKGKEDVPLRTADEMIETARSLGVTDVCVAITEDDAVHGWYTLITRGMRQVFFVNVAYNAVHEKFECQGAPALLWGVSIFN
jgi:hypothetical protein